MKEVWDVCSSDFSIAVIKTHSYRQFKGEFIMVSKGRAYYNAEAWQQVAGRNQKLKVHSFKTKTQCKDSELEEKEG